WVTKGFFKDRMQDRNWDRSWFLSVRDVTSSTNERTAIFAIRPQCPAVDKLPSVFVDSSPVNVGCLVACLSSFPLDYVSRQKVGGTNMGGSTVEQLPVLGPATYPRSCPWSPTESLSAWLLPRVLELTYTAWDLQPFAADCDFNGPPFRWDEERRFQLR